ncbi:hypothetical protein BDE27_3854 [Xenorhabdus ehlersii]|uniref:Phytanoyl-CoA dioxygenase n=1 Tax=Xenorhabdus ehlersii TaxID=290111 RepID=A0A2D0IK97_9GAMM|nr:phytanoyl-CoA dioxygenase [Xenorhabdus sp. TS4]PHM22185.1 phytanoyl-CoA dioxygenase [Xenorhabdus ehlersii]RKE87046.1 hypothetical protein BDE27_3854 [Xenorhabdus ehlersii]
MNITKKMYEQGYVVIPEIIGKKEIEAIRDFYKKTSEINNLSTLGYDYNLLIVMNVQIISYNSVMHFYGF